MYNVYIDIFILYILYLHISNITNIMFKIKTEMTNGAKNNSASGPGARSYTNEQETKSLKIFFE